MLGADGSGTAYAPEYDGSASYAPVHFLAFTYAGNSAPTVTPGAITTANVTLGNAWTLDLADVFTDADGDTLTYTATINGVAQALNGTILGYTPTAAGTYTVVLTASDNTGTATHTITLTVADANQQIPRLKEGVSSTASDTVTAGYAYNLTDLQAGNIFENPDGTALDYTNYYYYRYVGDTRTGPYYFTPALFGGTTIQITENAAGTYVYEFHATNTYGDSTDTWTLTLDVRAGTPQNYTFYVGQDVLEGAGDGLATAQSVLALVAVQRVRSGQPWVLHFDGAQAPREASGTNGIIICAVIGAIVVIAAGAIYIIGRKRKKA